MTTLANTARFLVEYDAPKYLTITARQTGLSKTAVGRRIAGDFRDCLKAKGGYADATCEFYLKHILKGDEWTRIYKPGKVRSIEECGL